MKPIPSFRKPRGFSLIEILIAVMVGAIGVTALVKLQGSLVESGSVANERATAISLAEGKLEQLRAYKEINSDADGQFDFADIVSSASCTSTTDPCGEDNVTSKTVGGTTYTLSWVVTDQDTIPGAAGIEAKEVDMRVQWTDRKGVTQAVAIENSLIKAVYPGASGLANSEGGDPDSQGSPIVTYTPSTDPGVTKVGVGTATSRETLVPTIDASSSTSTFSSYVYSSSGTLLRQEEFKTVACDCRMNGTGTGRTASHAIWSTTDDTYLDQAGDEMTKDVGCVPSGGGCSNNPDEFCEICCQDHHDPGATVLDTKDDDVGDGSKYCDPANGVFDRCYDPFRDAGGSDDHTSGKHQHYNSAGTAVASGTGQTGTYLEACRLKRIDGFWRVYQDWHLVAVNAFPLSVLDNSTNETAYADYVQDIIDAHLSTTTAGAKVKGESLTVAETPTKPAVIDRDSTSPVAVNQNATEQLTARGLYLDYISNTDLVQNDSNTDSHLAKVIALKQDGNAATDYLLHVPFYEVELTSQRATSTAHTMSDPFGWSSADTTKVSVGPTGSGASAIAAGVVKGLAATTSPHVDVTYQIRKSNSGLAGANDAIDNNASAANRDGTGSASHQVAIVTVSVTGAAGGTHSLAVTLSGGTPTASELLTASTGTCTGSGTSYTCTVADAGDGTLSFSGTNAAGETCSGSGSYLSSDATATVAIVCTGGGGQTFSPTVTITASHNVTNNGTVTATVSGNAIPYACTQGSGANSNVWTCTTASQIAQGSTMIFSFTGTATGNRTCTLTSHQFTNISSSNLAVSVTCN